MRRDRAGCWITMDEVLFFETCAFEIWCEKERWASGRVVRTVETDGGVDNARASGAETLNEKDERDVVRGAAARDDEIRDGASAPRSATFPSRDGWALELDASVPALVASAGVSLFGDENTKTVAQTPHSSNVLGLELCLVGTCAGEHLAMTRECELQAWKVASPRSFAPRPAMCVISEEMSSSESWSEDDSGGDDEPRFEAARGEAARPTAARRGDDALGALAGPNAEDEQLDEARAGRDGPQSAAPPPPWSIVPWKSHAGAFDKAEVLRNVRERYDDLMREYHDSRSELRGASDELFAGELTWFSAGVRVGVGMGLGVCLGLGLGVGILVNGYRSSRDRLSDMRHALRLR